MKTTIAEFAKKYRSLVGDETISVPDDFIVNALNWAFNSLPSVPKLERAFMKHYTDQLDANGHYRFPLGDGFRRIADIKYLNFYTSTGGDPCPLKVCNKDNVSFYKKNGVIELKVAGKPCEYTIEREDDKTILVLDRPSNVPIIIDYIAYGYPQPVKGMYEIVMEKNERGIEVPVKKDVVIELSAVVETLIIAAMRRLQYMEASDYAFAGSITDYLDNKEVVEAIQMLNKRYGNESYTVLGEA